MEAEDRVARGIDASARAQLSLLRHHPRASVQRGEIEIAKVDTTDGDPPVDRVVQAEQHVDHRALAASALANERADCAVCDLKAHSAEHLQMWVPDAALAGVKGTAA